VLKLMQGPLVKLSPTWFGQKHHKQEYTLLFIAKYCGGDPHSVDFSFNKGTKYLHRGIS
jgi:hypothetical protein